MIRKGWMIAAMAALASSTASGAELRVACYSDGNECEVTQALAQRFTAANPDVHVRVETVPYKTIQESLPVQLAAGQGPDIARVTDFGAIARYFLDMRPLLPDAAYWDTNFGAVLPWMQAGAADHGIYGLPTQLTITGPIVNKTLFEQAGMPLPAAGATWAEWAAATTAVAHATKTDYAMAMDRSGHRFAGAAISYGAQYFAADGAPAPVDAGFKAFASQFVGWMKDGTLDREVWAASGGATYRDAFEDFAGGRVVTYVSGSWQVSRRLQKLDRRWIRLGGRPPALRPRHLHRRCRAVRRWWRSSSPRSRPKEVAQAFSTIWPASKIYAEMTVKTLQHPRFSAVAAEIRPDL